MVTYKFTTALKSIYLAITIYTQGKEKIVESMLVKDMTENKPPSALLLQNLQSQE